MFLTYTLTSLLLTHALVGDTRDRELTGTAAVTGQLQVSEPSECMQVPHVSCYTISSDHRQPFSHFCLRETKETKDIGSDVIPRHSTADVCL